jgi:hypothetical protein
MPGPCPTGGLDAREQDRRGEAVSLNEIRGEFG